MVDYVNEYVLADNDNINLVRDIVYPITLFQYHVFESDFVSTTYGVDNVLYTATWVYSYTGFDLPDSNPFAYSGKIYAFLMISFDGTDYYGDTVVNSIGVGYYLIREAPNVSGAYDAYFIDRIPDEYVPTNIINPFPNGYSGNLYSDGDGIFLLYDIGYDLMNFVSFAYNDILMIKIGNTNLFTVLFGTGFFVYAVWVVVKFAIPL